MAEDVRSGVVQAPTAVDMIRPALRPVSLVRECWAGMQETLSANPSSPLL